MSTNSYQFNRGRKLSRSTRAESKQELGYASMRCKGDRSDAMGHNRWRSIAALGVEDNFSRLKKNYETMRKSFRLRLSSSSSGDHKARDFAYGAAGLQCDEPKRNLMGQLGSGAARLLRGVYAKSQRANHHQELDSLRATDGSFKVLSPTSLLYDLKDQHDPPMKPKKSDAELEIEQRLRRSKRRVLNSAKYQAPESEKACEGLNMEELEEIKRDNLRMTLTKSQKSTIYANQVPKEPVEKEFESSLVKSLVDLKSPCICDDIYCGDDNHKLAPQPAGSTSPSSPDPHCCTCASISSSFSSLNRLIDSEDEQLANEERIRGPQVFAADRESAGCQRPQQQREQLDNERPESRASSSFVSDKIEDRLREMFNFMGHKLESLNSERDYELENGCGESEVNSGNPSICLQLSPNAEQKLLSQQQQQQQQDTKICNHQLQQEQQTSVNAKVQKLAIQQVTDVGGKVDEELRPESEQAAVSCLGGANLNGQVAEQEQQTQQQQVNGGNGSNCSSGGQLSAGREASSAARNNKALARSYTTSYSHRARLKSNSANAIGLVAGRQLACAGTIGRQYMDRNVKQVALAEHWHPFEEQTTGQQPNQTISDLQSGGQLDREVVGRLVATLALRRQNQRDTSSASPVTNTKTNELNDASSNNTKDHHHHKQERRSRRQEEVMPHQTSGESCACNQGRANTRAQQADMINQGGSAYQLELEPHCDEHLYASIIDPLTPSPERIARQRQMKHRHQNQIDPLPIKNYRLQSCRSEEPRRRHDREMSEEKCRNFADESSSLTEKKLQSHMNNVESNNGKTTKTKKSLFGRLKNMIAPTGRGSNKQSTNYEWLESGGGELCGSGTLKVERQTKSSRWQRSSTLTHKSTQNLMGKSFKYLSNSKKSINFDDDAYEYFNRAEPIRPLTSAGFVTLGRRADGDHPNQLTANQIFHTRDSGQLDGFGGSADSLPSADSGLSCSNLQNSSSSDDNYAALKTSNTGRANSNLYSRGPSESRRSVELRYPEPETIRYRVIGKAKAMVDCNPCAYDKEALVFKRGDIIDILERRQTGTWVGHCNGQTGHFKFINVMELTSEGEDEETEGMDMDMDNGSSRRHDKNNGVYVTKLEIRSNNNNNGHPGDQIKSKIGPEPLGHSGRTNAGSSTIDRRSKSLSTINQQIGSRGARPPSGLGECGITKTGAAEAANNQLSSSNETIMSSLEQLLFAIGLADEKVDCQEGKMCDEEDWLRKSDTATTDNSVRINRCNNNSRISKGLGSKWSYLDVLNRGGINNLDSFSTIDDWHELEQIGIIDDEHQRRLLMAARIIRQASQAAKLDFVENQRIRTERGASSELTDCESQAMPKSRKSGTPDDGGKVMPDARKRTTSGVSICKQQVRKSAKKGDGQRARVNEPIYVNLIGGRGPASIVNYEPTGGEDHGSADRMTVMKLDQKQSGDQSQSCSPTDRAMKSQSGHQCKSRQRHDQIVLSGSNFDHADSKKEMNQDSINQPDHYHSCCTDLQSSALDTSLAVSDEYYDYDENNDYYHDGGATNDCIDNAIDCREETNELSSSVSTSNNCTLNRGYSIRVNSRNSNGCFKSGKYNQISDLDGNQKKGPQAGTSVQTNSGKMMDEIELSTRFSRRSLARVSNSQCASVVTCDQPQRRRLVSGEVYQGFDANKSNCNLLENGQSAKDPRERLTNQNDHQSIDSTLNLGSQINSKSAYDLRIDLSHFFS